MKKRLLLTLGISNVGEADYVPVNIAVKQPIAGVLAWEVTLKLWTYGKP